MVPILIAVTLAGAILLFSRRQHVWKTCTRRHIEAPVVVKGHTFSDCKEKESIRLPRRLEEIRRICLIGTGYGDRAALTALILADRNRDVQVDVADRDTARIAAWNSDYVPVNEPGVDELLFDDALEINPDTMYSQEIHRKKRLANVAFSTDVAGCIAAADAVFLFDETNTHTIRTIARASTGHKIIVQKGRDGIDCIKKQLEKAPTAFFDVLTSPDFVVPGSILYSLLQPSRIVIGNTPDKHSLAATILLKKLYSWIPPDRIIITDTWSAELGRLATNALLAQHSAIVHSLTAICTQTQANSFDVSRIVGADSRIATCPVSNPAGDNDGYLDEDTPRKEIDCLVYLAKKVDLPDIATYWDCTRHINDTMNERVRQKALVPQLPDRPEKIAIIGFLWQNSTEHGVRFVQTLVQRGHMVNICDPYTDSRNIIHALGPLVGSGVKVMDDIESAVTGCNTVGTYTDTGLHRDILWSSISGLMSPPKLFLDPQGVMDRRMMGEYGFRVGGDESMIEM